MTDQPLIVAPALSVIVAELGKRPAWQRERPFKVPAELWEAGREEMAAIQRKRGFALPIAGSLIRAGVAHFMVHGTAIVSC